MFRVLILPVLACDKAHIRVRYGAFRPLKWAISHDEMVHIATQENIPYMQIVDIQYIILSSYISRIFVQGKVCSQIRAYFSGYISKKRPKNQNPVTI